MRMIAVIAQRELAAYFATPVATVFIVIFLALQGALTFNLGNFFDRGQADLELLKQAARIQTPWWRKGGR